MTGCKRLMYTMTDLAGLRRLCLKTRGFSHLGHWPVVISAFKGLQELNLDFGAPNVIGGSIIAAFASWPKTIRKLRLSFREAEKCWNQVKTSEYFPCLEELDLEGWSGFKAAFIKDMPPNFSSLILRSNTSSFITNIIAALPRDFQHLSLLANPNVDRVSLEALPPTLKTLRLEASTLEASWVLLIPSTVTNLTVRVEGDHIEGFLKGLPPNLKCLSLSTGWSSGMHTFMDASKLPSTLETLRIIGSTDITMKLEDLPENLTALELDNPSMPVASYERLPRTLRHLQLKSAPRSLLCDRLIEVLPKTLYTLCVRVPNYPRVVGLLTEDAIPNLPANLSELVLFPSDKITGESFAKLPRLLSVLDLHTTTFILDEHIQHLPKYLQVLRIPLARNLTNAFAPLLPRGLSELIITENDNFTFDCVPDLPPYINKLELGHTGVKDRYESERLKRSKKL